MKESRHKDTVLIVDDGEDNLQFLSSLLYQAGMNVMLAQSGYDALTSINRKRPDLILLDIVMPQMDGFTVCRHLKQEPATQAIPVIFLTAKTDSETMLGGFELGAVDYIAKPFHPPELLARVQTHLELQRARDMVETQNRLLAEQNQRLEQQTLEIQELSAAKERYLADALHERVKELNCLYAISRLIEDVENSLDDIIQGTVNCMPAAWQYPALTCSRIVYEEREFVSPDFCVTVWGQQRPILVHERRVGVVEVYYREACRATPENDPFLEEEGDLMTAIAGRMGRVIGRMQAENALRRRERQYRLLAQNVADGIGIIQDDRLVFVNEALCAIVGYANETLIGMSPGELFPEADAGQPLTQLAKDEFDHNRQARCATGDGREIWVEIRRSRIDWHGTSSLIMDIRDISSRKIRELAVEEEKARLHSVNITLRASLNERFRLGDIIGKSAAMQGVYESILNAAESDASVVVSGESGTGKELVAWTIHRLSGRAKRVFVPVNCGAIPETLFESTFFGHRKGAFTGAHQDHRGIFESTRGGTLFLDEVGELTAVMQVKLLRALAGGGYTPLGAHDVKATDVRIIAATNRDLADMVRQGRMREDFYYRITVITITLPPLRKRKEDIPLLVDHFWQRFDDGIPRLPGSMLKELYDYDWPGNIRELQNALQRYLTTKRLDFIAPDSPSPLSAPQPQTPPILTGNMSLRQAVEAFEHQYILQTLEEHQWQRGKTAEILHVDPKTLYRKLKQYQV